MKGLNVNILGTIPALKISVNRSKFSGKKQKIFLEMVSTILNNNLFIYSYARNKINLI